MNETIKVIQQRHSTRAFSKDSVKEEDLELILRSVQNAPTSMSAQQISLIVVEDKDRIAKLAEITGGQPQVAAADKFIVVVVDFNRTQMAISKVGREQCIHHTVEGQLVGAVDAGIMVGLLDIAIQSLGYGATIIGGLRDKPEEAIELLNLPKLTYPMVGITIGVLQEGDKTGIRPRVPFEGFAMKERYNNELVKEGIDAHDKDMASFWEEQGNPNVPNYSEATANIYENLYYPNTKPSLEKQGFGFE